MTAHALEPECPVDESFDPLSPEFLADPFAVLGKLPPGPERPVFFAPSIGYYVVTRHAEIEQVFRDHDTYSAAIAQAPLVPLVSGRRLVAARQQDLLRLGCQFDLSRPNADQHVAFGKGLHYCLGANLGKLEASSPSASWPAGIRSSRWCRASASPSTRASRSGPAVVARPVRPGSPRPTRQVVRSARLRWRILTF